MIDRAGWQCNTVTTGQEGPEYQTGQEVGERCRRAATHTHRRRTNDKTARTVALCPIHYRMAGPEANPTMTSKRSRLT
ncbi:MAG: hypothetical protein ACRDRU_17635 [Pseudonocardiaceae bacterium]